LLTFGENTLGGKLGFVATLHTWDQKLDAHFQLHCLVAAVPFLQMVFAGYPVTAITYSTRGRWR
jgi:hypothetical protein